ncbi:N-methyl-L-tryptophan oxidase [Telmatocola sphagniphila]|uniref:N-methyl-L-tryptophan oxidase n=1 Tax=Telmatocola sphagniphila TaxID=1123043 RepID=A0A8E6B241_9BACT|nr:N-methyl-L-tryptophan oxidase [Telmatocola sphagniphila]QVL29844.1 N-methyl-L-tryptophan oxidase [Telmatocola sphagniphila]
MNKILYDAAIIGLGAMGLATAGELSRRGLKVIGMEQFTIPNDQGSSHGKTRIIRKAYYEHPDYVPLADRAFHLWRDLERESSQSLLLDSHCLSIGPNGSSVVEGVRESCREHHLPIESLSSGQLQQRYPAFQFDSRFEAVAEMDAGILRVEECLIALANSARKMGADLHENETVKSWERVGPQILIQTNRGEYRVKKLILTAGPWSSSVLKKLAIPLKLMRQTTTWLKTGTLPGLERGEFPIFLADTPTGCFYGIPSISGQGLKIAQHYGAPEVNSPEEIEREYSAADAVPVRDFLKSYLPHVNCEIAEGTVCIYTLSPDRHFIIDRYPTDEDVCFAAGFSGHGFKFAPVIGELLADLVEAKDFRFKTDLFQLARFKK